MNRLTPELDVLDLVRSMAFYIGTLGFSIAFQRPEERFICIELEGVQMMLEEAVGPGRRFRTAPLEYPYGRGVNFQIEVADVDALYARVIAAASALVIPLEERWYRQGQTERGNRQFVVADPDGYLLRFVASLGRRALSQIEN
jgi:catechol 2,3-dioxygenase-like lactoylglutathione lyase family enzyme